MMLKLFIKIKVFGIKNTALRIFNRISGYNKVYIIQDAVNLLNAKTYLEIGVHEGSVFKQVIADSLTCKIAVDPIRHEKMNNLQSNEHFFQKTSDDFFLDDAQIILKDQSIDIAFIDGLHEFNQVIRDFYNVEKYMSDDGIIIIHDCNPLKEINQIDRPQDQVWNGDVWKLPFYIISKRSDLHFKTLNCDHGIGIVYGFNKKTCKELDFSEVKRIKKLDFNFLKKNRKQNLNLVFPLYWKFIKHALMFNIKTTHTRS